MKEERVGAIIEVSGPEFLTEFINNEPVENYQFVLCSNEITNNKKYPNVVAFNDLVPPSMVTEYFFINERKEYKRQMFDYLQRPEVHFLITSIMESVVNRDKFIIVLLSSEEESEMKYVKLIRKFIEKFYNFPTYNYREWVKACQTMEFKQVDDLTPIRELLAKELKGYEELRKSRKPNKIETGLAALKKMSKKELKEFCKAKGYKKKKYKDLEEEELRKFVLKKFKKEYNL